MRAESHSRHSAAKLREVGRQSLSYILVNTLGRQNLPVLTGRLLSCPQVAQVAAYRRNVRQHLIESISVLMTDPKRNRSGAHTRSAPHDSAMRSLGKRLWRPPSGGPFPLLLSAQRASPIAIKRKPLLPAPQSAKTIGLGSFWSFRFRLLQKLWGPNAGPCAARIQRKKMRSRERLPDYPLLGYGLFVVRYIYRIPINVSGRKRRARSAPRPDVLGTWRA